MRLISEITKELGLRDEEVEPFGHYVAKIHLDTINRLQDRPTGKYVVVAGVSPTPLGEGKTTTTLGLAMGLCKIGVKAAAAIRQASLGPVFGVKGGATGGGKSQVMPADKVNLHLTGDNHAVQTAHNLAAAFLDNHLHHGNALGIDTRSITFPRALDLNDRALRKIVIGLGGRDGGVPRETDTIIATASEVMAIFALAHDLKDLRARLGRIVVAENREGKPVTVEELKVAGAMAVVLKDALAPNILQTSEGGPCFVHGGPFANVAHGANSVVADRLALKLCDVVVTECGFGSDLGAEKIFDIKCRQSGIRPSAAVVVATLRTLKLHGGIGKVVAGKPLDPALSQPNVDAVRKGCENLKAHVEIIRKFGVPCVVALNAFPEDTDAEVEVVRQAAREAGAIDAVVSRHFSDGGAGATDLARAVMAACEQPSNFAPIYPDDLPLAAKIEKIAKDVYGADGVDIAKAAGDRLAKYEAWGYGKLSICMAKTQYSLSADPNLKGRPRGFRVPVREVRLAAGAGFITCVTGDLMLMPGLPSKPVGESFEI